MALTTEEMLQIHQAISSVREKKARDSMSPAPNMSSAPILNEDNELDCYKKTLDYDTATHDKWVAYQLTETMAILATVVAVIALTVLAWLGVK